MWQKLSLKKIYVNVYTHTHIYIFVCVFVCKTVFVCVCLYVCMCKTVCLCLCLYVCVCIFVCVCMFVCKSVTVYVSLYVFVCKYWTQLNLTLTDCKLDSCWPWIKLPDFFDLSFLPQKTLYSHIFCHSVSGTRVEHSTTDPEFEVSNLAAAWCKDKRMVKWEVLFCHLLWQNKTFYFTAIFTWCQGAAGFEPSNSGSVLYRCATDALAKYNFLAQHATKLCSRIFTIMFKYYFNFQFR